MEGPASVQLLEPERQDGLRSRARRTVAASRPHERRDMRDSCHPSPFIHALSPKSFRYRHGDPGRTAPPSGAITTSVARRAGACATVPDRQNPDRPAIDGGRISRNPDRSQVSPGEWRRVCPSGRSKPCRRSRHRSASHQKLPCRSPSRSSQAILFNSATSRSYASARDPEHGAKPAIGRSVRTTGQPKMR